MKKIKTIILMIFLFLTITATITAQATFVEMEKTHTPEKVNYNCGEVLEFNVTLTVRTIKDGPVISIKNLKIRDTLPSGLTFLPGNRTSAPTAISFTNYGNGTLLWDFGPGPFTGEPQATIRFNVTVDNDAPEGVFVTNKATAFYEETVSGAPSAPAVTDPIQVIYPILDIEKTCSGPIHEGGNIVYTIMLKNTGHQDAVNITVTDYLPNDVSYTPGAASATSGNLDETMLPGQLLWKGNIGNITGIHTVNITIPVTDKPQIISSLIADNASYTETRGCERLLKAWDTCETPVIHPEITLTKTCTTSSTVEPANITLTYTVTNTGDTPLSNVTVYDETHDIQMLGPIDLAPSESSMSTLELLNRSAGLYTDTANASGTDFLGLTVWDHDDAECTIHPVSPPVGGDISDAVTMEQRVIWLTAIILCAAAAWLLTKQ